MISNKPRIAFLGLGTMGGGMARRLLDAGYALTVYNRSHDKAAPLAEAGARVGATPADAAREAEVIISMVSDDDAARAVWLGPQGALAAAKAGAICIESSTVTIGWVHELAKNVQEGRGLFLDAPVSGSKGAAAEGQLSFLVGGDLRVIEEVRPILNAMGKAVTRIGPVGSGATLKLINNFVSGVQVAALAEALVLIERCGLDRSVAMELLASGTPGSPMVKAVTPRMMKPDYTPNFMLRWMAKDLRYAIGEANARAQELKTAGTALAVFERAISDGHGDQDLSAVVESVRKGAAR